MRLRPFGGCCEAELRLLLLYPPKLTSDSVVELRGLRLLSAARCRGLTCLASLTSCLLALLLLLLLLEAKAV